MRYVVANGVAIVCVLLGLFVSDAVEARIDVEYQSGTPPSRVAVVSFGRSPWHRRSSISAIQTTSSSSTFRRPTRRKDPQKQLYHADDKEDDHFFDDDDDNENQRTKVDPVKNDRLEQSLDGYRPWSIQQSQSTRRPGSMTSWTTRLVTANILVYALQLLSPSLTVWGAKRSDLLLQGRQLYRLVTPMFLHGGVTHLLLNTFSLKNIGPEVERLFGEGRFLALYVVGGMAGNAMSAYYTPNPSLGASGAIFGLVGAYYVFLSRNGELLGQSGKTQMDSVTKTMAINFLFGFASPSIDNWGHIGGAIGGATMAYAFGPKISLLALPNGGRILADKPTVRLPRTIEFIPEQMIHWLSGMNRKMQGHRYTSDLTPRPWRRRNMRKIELRKGRPIKPRFAD